MSERKSLKSPEQPMPSFVREALIERTLMMAYKERPPYQRNNYVSWITSAKRDETKKKRLNQMLIELEAGNLYMKMHWSSSNSSQDKKAGKEGRKVKNNKATKLLSSSNPQIGKGYGSKVVQEYINAMPEWKKAVGQWIDELIVKVVPEVDKAVKWNTPLYGIPANGFFMAMYCYTKYVQVTFFAGESLKPKPPVESKQKGVRYLKIYEDERPSESQLRKWIKQASKLPGEKL